MAALNIIHYKRARLGGVCAWVSFNCPTFCQKHSIASTVVIDSCLFPFPFIYWLFFVVNVTSVQRTKHLTNNLGSNFLFLERIKKEKLSTVSLLVNRSSYPQRVAHPWKGLLQKGLIAGWPFCLGDKTVAWNINKNSWDTSKEPMTVGEIYN